MTNFHGDEAKKIFFEETKTKWPTKKTEFFKIANSQCFMQKFHGLVLALLELIDGKDIDVAQSIQL